MEPPPQSDKALISVTEAQITDLGGIYARQGFSYQDDVAVSFFLQMLDCSELTEVWCETHDDILLVWNRDGIKIAEYVQVKSEHPNQLWTVAKLCERSKQGKNQSGIGSSILEKSLSRDQYFELSWFRVVTSRQINSSLALLTREREHEHRAVAYKPFELLVTDVTTKVGEFRSKKGNDALYWLVNAYWEVKSEGEIVSLNTQALMKALYNHNFPCEPDIAGFIYDHLRSLAKSAAELGAENRKQKCITRGHLLDKIRQWIQPYPNSSAPKRLERKLTDAGLDVVCCNVAKEQRRFYLEKKRAAAYLTTDEIEEVEQQVLSLLHRLRSSLDAGDIEENGVEFHSRCLKDVCITPAIKKGSTISLPPGFLSGCMYEITARCRHRFMRLQP